MGEIYNGDNQGDNAMYDLVVKLKEVMIRQDVTLNQLARDSGVSAATLSRMLNFKTYPNFGTLYQIFIELGIEIDIAGYTLEGGTKAF